MVRVRRSALLPYRSAALYDIVNDVPRYPEFLPWCTDAEIVERSGNEMIAALSLSAGGATHTFTTRNILTPFEKIEMNLLSGPFSELQGGWTFVRLGEDQGCRVELALGFRVRGVQSLFGRVFSRAADQMVDAFRARADALLKEA